MKQPTPGRLPEYDIRISPSPSADPLTQTDEAIGQDRITLNPPDSKQKLVTSTCQCYIPSSPDQQFRVMVTNTSEADACVTLLVDGEWVYSGLNYQPDHKVIYFSGRLIDEATIQEMRFVDLDTTCITPLTPLGLSLMVDDSSDGAYPKDGLGTIVVRIHRVKVTGPWEGKLIASTPTQSKPVLMGEKTVDMQIDHRVGYYTLRGARLTVDFRLQLQ